LNALAPANAPINYCQRPMAKSQHETHRFDCPVEQTKFLSVAVQPSFHVLHQE
jgi:hypothetical protein